MNEHEIECCICEALCSLVADGSIFGVGPFRIHDNPHCGNDAARLLNECDGHIYGMMENVRKANSVNMFFDFIFILILSIYIKVSPSVTDYTTRRRKASALPFLSSSASLAFFLSSMIFRSPTSS